MAHDYRASVWTRIRLLSLIGLMALGVVACGLFPAGSHAASAKVPRLVVGDLTRWLSTDGAANGFPNAKVLVCDQFVSSYGDRYDECAIRGVGRRGVYCQFVTFTDQGGPVEVSADSIGVPHALLPALCPSVAAKLLPARVAALLARQWPYVGLADTSSTNVAVLGCDGSNGGGDTYACLVNEGRPGHPLCELVLFSVDDDLRIWPSWGPTYLIPRELLPPRCRSSA